MRSAMPPLSSSRQYLPIPYAFTESARFVAIAAVSYPLSSHASMPRIHHHDDIVIRLLQIPLNT